MLKMATFVPNTSCGPCLYCNGTSQDAPEDLLRCDLCRRSAHILCLKSGVPEGCLLGDNFFNFTCSVCHVSGQDITVRARLNMPHILLLVLYNLHKTEAHTSRCGFFHWKIHIYNFINHHWKEIFGPESRKRKKKVVQSSLSGQLSCYGQYFVSGYETLRDGGWYKLVVPLSPARLIQRQLGEKGRGTAVGSGDLTRSGRRKILKDEPSKASGLAMQDMHQVKEELVEESVSSGDVSFDSHDDSSRGSWFTERELLKPHACPPQALFDSEEEEEQGNDSNLNPQQVKIESGVIVKEEVDIDLMYRKEENQDDTEREEDGDFIDVDGNEGEIPMDVQTETQPQEDPLSFKPSLFTKSTAPSLIVKDQPNESKEVIQENLRLLSGYEERQLLRKLEYLQESGPLPPHLHRLRRKLVVRKLKVEHGLPLFNLDVEIKFLHSHGRLRTRRERAHCKILQDPNDSVARILDRFLVGDTERYQKEDKISSFLVKLTGDSEGMPPLIHSPYTLRKLKPFIMRDYEITPRKLKLLQEIIAYSHRDEVGWCPPPRHPIDYCYVTPKHIPAMNQLARQFFWPGIDFSEVLQYPDYTCVVLYQKLVLGFGVLVPDVGFSTAYLSFLLVHPEWQRAGIAKFVLYHLIQTCMGKDVTLHVSATNPALILYQRFGFKVEEFLYDFYDKYLPEDSPECKHAMYLRLSR